MHVLAFTTTLMNPSRVPSKERGDKDVTLA